MRDDVSDISAFYDEDPERENVRLADHQLEYEVTWRYLQHHLPPGAAILDVGAGTGRYAIRLARLGHRVHAVDLSSELVSIARSRVQEEGLEEAIRLEVADARDLSGLADRRFDAVLLMGPLYHLIHEEDRRLVLREVRSRLRAGGLIFSALLSRYGVLGDLLKRNPTWIRNESEVRALLQRGTRPDDAPRGGFRGYFSTVEEVAPFHESEGFLTLTLAGVEPAISADDQSFNEVTGEDRERWIDLFHQVSTEPSILGASRHLLYIGQRRED